ncbi:MAG: DUF433 domain-containing protein [Desulfobacterales bacterium]|jgi:uncharacterized protein (DUF433 family)
MREEKLLKRVVTDPRIMIGKPVIKGTRLTVELIVEKMAYGATVDDLIKDYPFLTEEDIRSALLYAAKRLANEEVYAA